jgi:pimeloyl-ACP methyl ester carboxylesterase
VSGHGIATLSTGKGPPVLLINGWCCPADAWGAVPTALAEAGLRAVAVDLPGWGRSLAPEGMRHRAIEYADALGPVLDELGPLAGIVGYSLGAQVVLVLATRRPQGIGSVVLLAPMVVPIPVPTIRSRDPLGILGLPLIGPWLARVGLFGLRQRPELLTRAYARAAGAGRVLVGGDPNRDFFIAQTRRSLAETPMRVVAPAISYAVAADLRELAPDVTAPTLVVIAEGDGLAPAPGVTAFAKELPAARVLRVATGHFPHLDLPDVVVPAIVGHLRAPA